MLKIDRRRFSRTLVALYAALPVALAQLPYNPTRLFLSTDGSRIYQFSPGTSQSPLSFYRISNGINGSTTATLIDVPLGILANTTQAVLSIQTGDGISVLAGDCSNSDVGIWELKLDTDESSKGWQRSETTSTTPTPVANWLAAGFAYSPTGNASDTELYVFGGMCPTGSTNSTSWTVQATYSNYMLSASPQSPNAYELAATQSPPIAEAGLAVVPLTPLFSNSTRRQSSQQNFVLVGGHTQGAFINMSQVAVYSLPQGAWSFMNVDQPGDGEGELLRRGGTEVEPRSGHSAVLTEDGTKIVVFGGWVGDVSTPASPQLAILNIGTDLSSQATWSWTIPTQPESPYSTGHGVYGHSALLLPGNVMMISGGLSTESAAGKRAASNGVSFYNVSSSTWSESYTHPGQPKRSSDSNSSGMGTSHKAGLGVGLGVGLAAIIGVAVFWFLYRKRLKAKRSERERYLRELALGSDRYHSNPYLQSGVDGRGGAPEMRSASWGSAQERYIGSRANAYPWAPLASHQQAEKLGLEKDEGSGQAARTGSEMTMPSPTRGLRKSLAARGPAGMGMPLSSNPVTGPGSVFRIDEEDESRSQKSVRARTPQSRLSDPFKDPPTVEPRKNDAEQRRQEVQVWVDDWQSAAESMNLSRNNSHARTYSNLSQAHSTGRSTRMTGRSSSPDKSDRTGSNLSDRSSRSGLTSSSGVSANSRALAMSQRSSSAGHALFAGAAAAMGRLYAGSTGNSTLDRSASKRSVSLNTSQLMAEHRRHLEGSSLLRDQSPTKTDSSVYGTPPASPVKERSTDDHKDHSRNDSMTSQRSRTTKVLGSMRSMKRRLTGTSMVDVDAKLDHFEEVEKKIDPRERQTTMAPEISEAVSVPGSSPAVAFWRGRRGARDWDDTPAADAAGSSSANRKSHASSKPPGPVDSEDEEEYVGEDWDVESAVQKRVVQVMFTVPKEKLRVVNADQLSLISRSDVDEKEPDGIKRMDSLVEVAEVQEAAPSAKGKGRDVD